MHVIRLVLKNLNRHRLRLALTILGMAIAVTAVGLLRTVVTAWNAGVDTAASNRMITRHSVSFIFPLPFTYRERIQRMDGVDIVSYANWFGGTYIDKNQFFPRMAIDPETFFRVYPEFVLDQDGYQRFLKTRNGCVIGRKIAKQYGLKIGDNMILDGDIYPGRWEFQVAGIYAGKTEKDDETQMLFHWKYLDESLQQSTPIRAGRVGWYVFTVNDRTKIPAISAAVDREFSNSDAETKTETERAFQQGFVSMSGAIISVISIVSYIIIGIVLLVLANTMIMTARERVREYAVFKTLGFTTFHLTGLIAGESLVVASMGGGLGLLLTFPLCAGFSSALSTFFPVFIVEPSTIAIAAGSALAAGLVASIVPIVRTTRATIVDGLRSLN
jgi:putative ABC transport system permease protein